MTSRGFVSLSIATLTYGVLHVIDKAALREGVDSSSYTIARVFIAALTLFLFTMFVNRPALRSVARRQNLKDLVILGVLASGWGLLFQMWGLATTTATNAALLLALVAPITSLFAVVLLREQLSRGLVVATALMGAGVTSVYGLDQSTAFGRGDMLILLAVTGYGYSNVLARMKMRDVDTIAVTLGRLVFGALSIVLVIPFLSTSFSSLSTAPLLVAAGGVIFAIRMVAYYKGIELEGAAVAATFLLASPVVTAIAANLFLGEPLKPQLLSGIALTALGGWFLVSSRNGVGAAPKAA